MANLRKGLEPLDYHCFTHESTEFHRIVGEWLAKQLVLHTNPLYPLKYGVGAGVGIGIMSVSVSASVLVSVLVSVGIDASVDVDVIDYPSACDLTH